MGAEWDKVEPRGDQIETKWAPTGTKWEPNGDQIETRWDSVGTSKGPNADQVETKCGPSAKWGQVQTKWAQVGHVVAEWKARGTKWAQMEPSGDQMGPHEIRADGVPQKS